MRTAREIINAAIDTVEEMRDDWVPHDTGNMANNALRYTIRGDVLDIEVDENIAPYVPYTNEPWNGKKNPNEGWWERFVEEFNRRFKAKIGGVEK